MMRGLKEILVGLLLGSIVFGVYAYTQTGTVVPNDGNTVESTLALYWLANQTSPVTLVDWGVISQGQTKNQTIYVHNNLTVSVALNISTFDWNPANATDYLQFWTDYDQTAFAVDEVRPLTLFLNASLSAPPVEFSFNIRIQVEEP